MWPWNVLIIVFRFSETSSKGECHRHMTSLSPSVIIKTCAQRHISLTVYPPIIQISQYVFWSYEKNNDSIVSLFWTCHGSWEGVTCAKWWLDSNFRIENRTWESVQDYKVKLLNHLWNVFREVVPQRALQVKFKRYVSQCMLYNLYVLCLFPETWFKFSDIVDLAFQSCFGCDHPYIRSYRKHIPQHFRETH